MTANISHNGFMAFLSAMFAVVVLVLAKNFAEDIFFYRKNGWDADPPSPRKLYWGEDADDANLMGSKAKMFFGYPFLIVCFFVVSLFTGIASGHFDYLL